MEEKRKEADALAAADLKGFLLTGWYDLELRKGPLAREDAPCSLKDAILNFALDDELPKPVLVS